MTKTLRLLNQLGLDAGTAQVQDDGRYRSPANVMKDGVLYVAEQPLRGQDIAFYRETPITQAA